jgi:hypothetical protein
MKGGEITTHRRINLTLPEGTLEVMDGVTEPGERSRFIDEAVKHDISEVCRGTLRKQLKAGAI